MQKSVLKVALVASFALSLPSHAAVNWALSGGTNPSPVYGNSRTFTPDSTTVNLTVNAYSATGNTSDTTSSNPNRNANTIESAYLSAYGSNGLGVVNRDGSGTADVVAVTSSTGTDVGDFVNGSTEHGMDNNGRNDVMLLTFTDQIALQSLKLGWVLSGGDSDLFVLAWSGPGTPTALDNGTSFASIAADTFNSPDSGWKLITSLSNVGTSSAATFNNGAAPVYSSYWLIGTGGFNSAATGGGVTSGDLKNGTAVAFGSCSGSGASKVCGNYDYVKLASVGGITNGSGTGGGGGSGSGVPEPGSLALAGAAFAGMMGLRRRKAVA